jgi:hypothetical protein
MMNVRRSVLKAGVASLIGAPRFSRASLTPAEEWMDRAIRRMALDALTKSLDKPATFTRFADPMYIVREKFTWTPDSDDDSSLRSVTVPVGFVTDLASVPEVLFSKFRADGDYAQAAVVHDYLYWFQPVEREVADRIFKRAMLNLDVTSSTADKLYAAVRFFGEKSWLTNQTLRNRGEKRVLKRFPDKANMRWSEWKNNPGNFV